MAGVIAGASTYDTAAALESVGFSSSRLGKEARRVELQVRITDSSGAVSRWSQGLPLALGTSTHPRQLTSETSPYPLLARMMPGSLSES